MDASLAIRPRQPLHKSYAPRDPMPVRGVAATELDTSKTVAAQDDRADRESHGNGRERDEAAERPAEHPPADVLADPENGELILRERDAVAAAGREHPDHALLLRAYKRPQPADAGEHSADLEA